MDRLHQRSRMRVALTASLLALQACSRPADPPPPTPPAAASPPPAAVPVISLPPPPTGRAELLAAVDAAASAQAAGTEHPEVAAALAGRRFTLKLPFGCGGPGPPGAALRYAYDADARTLRLTARPQIWTDTPLAALVAGPEGTEAVEGFWVRRPWLRTEACPAAVPGPSGASVSPTAETVGLAQAFEPGGSRLGRRGDRPYEATRKLPADTPPGPGGYRLVLEGRIADPPGGPVRCRAEGVDQRPVCLVQVELDRVAFEDPAGALIAEWRS